MRRLDNAGFSLLEVIIAATLLTMVIFGCFLLYERGVNDWFWTEEYTDTMDNLRIAVDRIVYEVREASDITMPGIGAAGDTLTFIDSTGRTITYYFDGDDYELERVTTTVTEKVYNQVASRISGLNFYRPNYATVNIEIKAKAPKTEEISVRTSAYARSL